MEQFKQFIYHFLDNFRASYTGRILYEAVLLLGQLWPYLVGGIILSTLIKLFISKEKMAGFFSNKRSVLYIFLAGIVGVISPLGSYVIIPLSAALLGTGVPLSVLMAMMVASPLMNPNLFVLTAGAMGLEMAVMRTISALLLGILAGFIALWLEKRGKLIPGQILRDGGHFTVEGIKRGGMERTARGFLIELYRMTKYISKYFFLAILLASAIKIAVNPKIIVRLFDSDNLLSVILSTAAGVPFYVCGGAAIPVVQQLADLGMSKGAVLAYFISGPVTKISNLVLIQATFRRIVLVQYLAIGLIGAVVIGMIYNLF
ncbi:MAG: permease [Bacteroidales bacterium]